MNSLTDQEQQMVSKGITADAQMRWCEALGLSSDRVHVAIVFAWQRDDVHSRQRGTGSAGEVNFLLSSTAVPEMTTALLRSAADVREVDYTVVPNANH